MTIEPIRTAADLRAAFLQLESVFQATAGTPAADEREALVTLIEAYENKHHAFGPAEPTDESPLAGSA